MASKKTGCLVLFGLFAFIVIIVAIVSFSGNDKTPEKTKKPPTTTSTTLDLKATVKFDGKQFIISNEDYFDWTNVKMEINSGLITSGYILREKRLEAGHTYTVGALQFAKGDGTRLNPWQVKPQRFSIWCDRPGGKGFWYGEFQ